MARVLGAGANAVVWHGELDTAIELMRLQISSRETPLEAAHVPLIPAAQWRTLTTRLRGSWQSTTVPERDAALVIWARGLVHYGGETTREEDEYKGSATCGPFRWSSHWSVSGPG